MKICYLAENTDFKHGGGRYAENLITAVRNHGHEVLVIENLKSGLGMFFSALKARKYIKNCDVIHAIDGYPYGVIAALANLGIGKKMVITIQGTYAIAPLYSFLTSGVLKWAYRKADAIIAISQYTKDEFLKKAKGRKLTVINHGIDFEKFHKESAESSENFILSVGALKFRKGYHVSIPAFALAQKEFPGLRYKIVGNQKDGDYFSLLKGLASKYGIDGKIDFLSGLSDGELSKMYQRAKIFILTSVNQGRHFEGFGLVFLEAAAAGLPVIGTLGNGIKDAVSDNFNGILIPQNDIENTAKAITRLIGSENLRKEMSLNSVSWARSHDWKEVSLKYIEIYGS